MKKHKWKWLHFEVSSEMGEGVFDFFLLPIIAWKSSNPYYQNYRDDCGYCYTHIGVGWGRWTISTTIYHEWGTFPKGVEVNR